MTVTRAEAPESEVAIELSSDSVEEGTEISVTMSFANLTPDSEANLVFRADVEGADACEGHGIGVDRNMSKVDEDPETRTGTISDACPAGDYTLDFGSPSILKLNMWPLRLFDSCKGERAMKPCEKFIKISKTAVHQLT